MPKRVPLLKSVTNQDLQTLACEWESCGCVFTDIQSLMNHVTEHLNLFLAFISQEHQRGLGYSANDESVFACYWRECSHESFNDFNSLLRHVYFHAFHVKLKAIGTVMSTKNNLQGCLLDSSARNLLPDIPERFACGWQACDKVYDNPVLFYMHIKNHCEVLPSGNHVKGGLACQWEGCEVKVKSKHKLKDHMRAHTQEKLAACPTCGALFANLTRLYDHIKRQTEIDGHSYQCSHCNKKYSTERLLKEHMRHHVNHYQCPLCDMTCPNPSNLRLHFRYRHANMRPYMCDQCNHTSKTHNDMRRHQEIHRNWLTCDLDDCKYRCHAVADLNRHYKLQHEYTEGEGVQRFQCHLCNHCYLHGAKLTNHLRRKHKFRWPPGHVRFRYKFHTDGYFRLQTVRYESIELTQQILPSDIAGGKSANVPSQSANKPPALSQSENATATGSQSQPKAEVTDETNQTGMEDVFDDIIIDEKDFSEGETPVNFSYNLDLLGDVALKNSVVSEENAQVDMKMYHNDSQKSGKKTSNVKAAVSKKRKRSLENAELTMPGVPFSKRQGLDKGIIYHSTPIKNKGRKSLTKAASVEQMVNLLEASDIGMQADVTVTMNQAVSGVQLTTSGGVENVLSIPDVHVLTNPPPETMISTIERTQAQFEGLIAIVPVQGNESMFEGIDSPNHVLYTELHPVETVIHTAGTVQTHSPEHSHNVSYDLDPEIHDDLREAVRLLESDSDSE